MMFFNAKDATSASVEKALDRAFKLSSLKSDPVRAPGSRRFSGANPAPVDDIIELAKSGKTVPQIEQEIGCSRPTIYNILRRNGVEYNKMRVARNGK